MSPPFFAGIVRRGRPGPFRRARSPRRLSVAAGLTLAACQAPGGDALRVAEFGGRPNDGRDDTAAFRKAFKKASQRKGATVVLAPGDYLVSGEAGERGALFTVRGARDFSVEGNGATLTVKTPTVGLFEFVDGKGVALRDFSVRYDPVPFAWGTVVKRSAENRALTVETNARSPDFDAPWIARNGQWGYFLSASVPGRLAAGLPNVVFRRSAPEALGGGRFRIPLEGWHPALENLEPGTRFVLNARDNQSPLLIARNCRDLRFENIVSYSTVGGHYLAVDSENIAVIGCEARIAEGMAKGGNADFIHFQNTRGPIEIRDNSVAGISDDAINLYSKPFFLAGRTSPRALRLSSDPNRMRFREGPGRLRAGDGLIAFDPVEGRVAARAEIVETRPDANTVVVDAPLPDDAPSKETLRFYGTSYNRGVRIAGNTFRDSRRFGIFLKAYEAVIRDNRFAGLSGSAIFISNEPGQYQEGLFSEDVRIAGNAIIESGFSANFAENRRWGAITVQALRRPHERIADAAAHRNITIERTTLKRTARGMSLAHARDLTVGPIRTDDARPPPFPELRVGYVERVRLTPLGTAEDANWSVPAVGFLGPVKDLDVVAREAEPSGDTRPREDAD